MGANPVGALQDGQFSTNSPGAIAVDATGAVYAVASTGNVGGTRVQRFTAGPVAEVFAHGQLTGATPRTIAIDPVAGRVFVAWGLSTVSEFDTDGNLIARHGSGSNPASSGLAVDQASGRLYHADVTDDRITVLGEPTVDPVATIGEVTAFSATTATVTGAVEPRGFPTGYHFEYRREGTLDWIPSPATDADAGPIGSVNPVSREITGLEPNTLYHLRLVATKRFAGGRSTSEEISFVTAPGGPSGITHVGALEVDDTDAWLTGRIDPNGDPTTYSFGYGTTPGLGLTTPVASAGNGNDPVMVSQHIAGLQPDTEYFFRLVANNSAGAASSNTVRFRTRAVGFDFPDRRSYEQVSPVDKNFGHVDAGNAYISASPDGERVAFCTTASFGEEPPMTASACSANYLSTRAEVRWETRSAVPNFCSHDPGETLPNTGVFQTATFSPTLDRALVNRPEGPNCTAYPPLDPAAPLGANLYRADYNVNPSAYSLLAPNPIASPKYGTANGDAFGGSADYGRLVYASTAAQTGDASGTQRKLYEWDHGTLRLVSKGPDGNQLAGHSAPFDRRNFDGSNSISRDGSRIFFNSPVALSNICMPANCELYMRRNGTATVWLSEPECVACGGTAADVFEWASRDGTRAYFFSTVKLSDDDTNAATTQDLYRYTDGPDPESEANLTSVSRDEELADGLDADVLGVIGVSDDGDTVYFMANGQLVAGAPTGAGMKVYRWRWNGGAPSTDYLATLAVSSPSAGGDDQNHRGTESGSNNQPTSYLTNPSGNTLVIETEKRLTPAVDTDSDRDVYRWREGPGWQCVSCQPPGVPSAGMSSYDANYVRQAIGGADLVIPRASTDFRVIMSDDGQRVFFTTDDALAHDDTNGVKDVYEWEDGKVRMVTRGDRPGRSTFVGASRDGSSVFFMTAQRLVGWDTDGFHDVYVARVGPGLPEPPPSEPPCFDDACQGTPSADAGPPSVGSIGVGSGNVSGSDVDASLSILRLAEIEGPTGRLKVKVPGAGRLLVSGPSVRRTSQRTPKAGTYSLLLALSPAARKRLKQRKALRVLVRVTFRTKSGESASQKVKVTFKRRGK